MDWLAARLLQFRFFIWLVVITGSLALWWFSRPIAFDQSVEGFFPPDHPALASYERAKRSFGNDDVVFVAYEDDELWSVAGMERVRELAELLQGISGVARVEAIDKMPVPWKVDAAARALVAQPLAIGRLLGGLSTVASEVRRLESDADSLESFRQGIVASPLFRNTLTDPAGRTTALVVLLKPPEETDSKRVVANLRVAADKFCERHGIARVAVVGPPVLVADGFISLDKDNRTLGLVAMALMAMTLLVAVRSPWWAMLPLVCGWATWQVTQAFLNVCDLKLTLSSGPIIAQTVVLCMPAASHLAMHFRAARAEMNDRRAAARRTLVAIAAPVAWCAVTAAIGYLATLSSSVRPVVQFGVTMAACNLIAGLLAFLLAAGAMLPPDWLRRARADAGPAARPRAEENLGDLTAWVIDHPARVLLLFVLPSVVMACGIVRLRFESNYINIYTSRSRVVRDYRFIEDRMGGIGLVELVFRSPDKVTAEWLAQLKDASAHLLAVDPDVVTQVLSLADVLDASRDPAATPPAAATHADTESPPPRAGGLFAGLLGTPSADATPDRVIETKLRVLGTPAYSHFLKNFWDRPSGTMRVLVRIREGADADRKQAAFTALRDSLNADLAGADAEITGLSHLMTQVTTAIITTQFTSTAWAGGLILLMLVAALRSLRLALLALVPTLLSVGLVLGAMGWLGVKIDLSTALVASVAMGLSVDDTFHCLLRFQRELKSGLTPEAALRSSYAGAGPGVVLSSAAVSFGFLAMIFSEFVPTANFGWLVAVATLGGSAGNLIVLPACLAISRRAAVAAPRKNGDSA